MVGESSFYGFVKNHPGSYTGSGITIRLPEIEPGQYGQVDFGRLGKNWDRKCVFRRIRTPHQMVKY